MTFSDYASKQTSALIERLLAGRSEATAQQLRTVRDAFDAAAHVLEASPKVDDDIADLVARLNKAFGDMARRIREEARAAVEAAHSELEAQRAVNEKLAALRADVEAQADVLRAELRNEKDRAGAAERDLAAVREACERLEGALAAAEAAGSQEAQARVVVENELRETRELLDTLRAQEAQLRGQFDAVSAEISILKAEAAAACKAKEQLETALSTIEAAVAREAQARSAGERELQELRASLDASLAEVGGLGARLEASASEKGRLLADLSAAQGELHTAHEQREAISAQLKASSGRVQTLERNAAKQEQNVRQLEAKLNAALNVKARRCARRPGGSTENASEPQQIEALHEHIDRLVAMLQASERGVDGLTRATTVAELLAALVRQLRNEFSRVALFRVKGKRLEGELQLGFELTTDITKLVIPFSVDSLLTRAASSGAVEILLDSEQGDGNIPFGGKPTAALALPVLLHGEPLAVVYVDDAAESGSASDMAADEASIGFAKLLVRQTVVLLMRLTHELKTLSDLRRYATMLLQEAECIYMADAEAKRTVGQMRSRLKENLKCARQLYAQRAAMEGATAAALLDEQIASVIDLQGNTPFGRLLAEVVGQTVAADTRRVAEAS